MHGRRSFTWTVALAFVLTIGATSPLAAQGTGAGNPINTTDLPDEGWTLDDIKDVFEAVHFFAITVGIGVGLWWFASRYLCQGSPLSVDLEVGGLVSIAGGERRVVELVAVIRNGGVSGSRIRSCFFSVAAIDSTAAGTMGLLRDGMGLRPLFEAEFPSSETTVAGRACIRLTAVVAIPGDAEGCLLVTRVESIGNQPAAICSRFLSFSA